MRARVSLLTVGVVVVAALSASVSTAPGHAASTHTMRIDATALSTIAFRLDRAFAPGGTVGTFDGTAVQTVDIEEGAYTVIVSSSVVMDCTPAVTAAGAWTYPDSCEGFLAGRGTETLHLVGHPITVDARPLSNTIRLSGFGAPRFFEGPETLRLVPNRTAAGSYTVQPGSGVVSLCHFNVRVVGVVDYPDAFEGCLSGRGTSTLTFNGVPVNVDATALTARYFSIPGANTLFGTLQSTGAVHGYRMLPLQLCCYGFRATGAPATSMGWNVDLSSRISYPASVEAWVDGSGTDTLTVHGYPITIDATRLGGGEFVLENRHFFPDPFDRATVQQTRMVPGDYVFKTAGFPAFGWSVTADGTLHIADEVECVTGEGATTLTIGCNRPPDCTTVAPDVEVLWPPNHALHPVRLGAASDPDGDSVSVQITSVTQDEPLDGAGDGTTTPDASPGAGRDQVYLRAERSGAGDGRVYRIGFSADDPFGGSCTGTVEVTVPHDQAHPAIDSGSVYNSFG